MTNKNEENYSFPIWLKIILAALALLLLLFSIFIIIKYTSSLTDGFIPDYPDRNEWGVFGDFFGGVLNPIFGFASFLALLATIFYQAKELNASTKELKNSAEALAAQNRAIELQSFEQTFFSWLNTYRSLLDSVETQTNYNQQPIILNGRRALSKFIDLAFIEFHSNLSKGSYVDDEQTILAVKESWNKLYKNHETHLDSLFRTLYRLFLWVDQNTKLNPTEKWLYISIVRSQLSWIEMVYLFYNCLTERGSKFKILVEKYAIFDNLAFNDDQSLTKLKPEYSDEAFSSDLAREKLGLLNTA
jgi:hypothetical protein